MSKLAVAAVGALTITGVGVAAIAQPDFFSLHRDETPEQQKARLHKEAVQAWCVLGGLAVVGTVIAMKTSHPDLGKGIVLGSGAILALGVLSQIVHKKVAA